MAIWRRQAQLQGLVHHSDRGSQYLSIRYTERLAETIIGLYKTELIRRCRPWKGLDDVEYATLEWVDWCNHRRLLEPIGHLPPAEFEAAFHRKMTCVGTPSGSSTDDPAEGLLAELEGGPDGNHRWA